MDSLNRGDAPKNPANPNQAHNATLHRRDALRVLAGSAAAGTLLAASAGCDPRMAMYFLQPFDPKIPPVGPSLKNKTVAILPLTNSGSMIDFPGLDRDLANQLGQRLASEGKRVRVIPSKKVFDWIAANPSWNDPSELGRELNADMVILLEVDAMQYRSAASPGLFQGVSKINLQVTEMKPATDDDGKILKNEPKVGEVIYSETVATTFPERGPVPADAKVTATAFKTKFLRRVVEELSWQFVNHEAGDLVQDTRFDK